MLSGFLLVLTALASSRGLLHLRGRECVSKRFDEHCDQTPSSSARRMWRKTSSPAEQWNSRTYWFNFHILMNSFLFPCTRSRERVHGSLVFKSSFRWPWRSGQHNVLRRHGASRLEGFHHVLCHITFRRCFHYFDRNTQFTRREENLPLLLCSCAIRNRRSTRSNRDLYTICNQ